MIVQRVTKSATRDNLLTWMAANQRRVSQHHEQIASGRRLNATSDDPSASVAVLGHRRQLERLHQFARNGDHAKAWVETSDATLLSVSDQLNRARTLLVQGANEVLTPEVRQVLRLELNAIADEVLALANTTIDGRSLFAGTQPGPAFGPAPGGGVQYDGDLHGRLTSSVGPGQDLEFGTPGSVFVAPGGWNVIDRLRQAADEVGAGATADVRAAMDDIDVMSHQVLAELGRVGTISARLDSLAERRDTLIHDTGRRMSALEDVDIADAVIRMRSAQASYEATLATVAQTLSTSLLNFLR
jgi:flagellar hook-associated protein 3 FlgL